MSAISAPRVVLVALAATFAFGPVPAPLVERYYSNTFYPLLQSRLTPLSNAVPFALFDALVALACGWSVWCVARDMSTTARAGASRRSRTARWTMVLVRALARTVTLAAVAYLMFLAIWGLNYRRVRLTEKLQFDAGASSYDATKDLVRTAVGQLNALYGRAHRSAASPPDAIDPGLQEGLQRAAAMVGASARTRAGVPKRTALDAYFRAAGVDGMTDPFFLETLVVSDLLPVERPFALAHEWSHLAGFADEGEANFVGWIACLHAGDRPKYSAWLFLYTEAVSTLDSRDRRSAAAALGAGPQEDLRAIADRLQRSIKPAIANPGWKIYDRYLKANRIEEGAASYAEVVRLILGTSFDRDWTPRLRSK